MKNLLLVLLVLSLASCGKENTVGTVASPLTSANSPIQTINADPTYQSLATSVTNNTFNAQYTNYYTEYHFGNVTNNCVTKDGWFGIDYQACSSSVINETTAIHGQIDIPSKQAELNSILSKTVVFQAYSSNYFILRTNDNYTYHIRTDFPIQANPVYKLNNADAKAVRLLFIK